MSILWTKNAMRDTGMALFCAVFAVKVSFTLENMTEIPVFAILGISVLDLCVWGTSVRYNSQKE